MSTARPVLAIRPLTRAPCSPLPPKTTAGYRLFSADADLAACAVLNPFSTCETTANKVFAVEIDGSCAVRVFVLGDTKCSQMEELAVVQG